MDVPEMINYDSWLKYLDEAVDAGDEHDAFKAKVAEIIRDYLVSGDANSVSQTATKLDDYYWKNFVPTIKDTELLDRIFPVFVSTVYRVVLEVACLIWPNDNKQDMLIKLLLEMKELTPRELKHNRKDHTAWIDDDLFDYESSEIYTKKWVSCNDPPDARTRALYIPFQNLLSFLALCYQNDMDAHNRYRSKYLRELMTDVFEREYHEPRSLTTNFWVKLAANWIMKAGPAIYAEFGEEPDKWELWAMRFDELAERYQRGEESTNYSEEGSDPHMAAIARGAYERMKVIDPLL
ncbi:hypothetical protein HYFRA_00000528 [Hymenoscyphus fraxineus]|uniref:Uncharacterized protein n=1 Tax=Hymenoscyphus fraxineus TaxID=746836 RepID=A0A9N9PSL5_9HELO|nr:hypothetical protein HYFRA_00000528 [Hymenoscyphus fraxineus]